MSKVESRFLTIRAWSIREYVAAATLVFLAALSFAPAFGALAEQYVDAGLKRSLVSFATVRTLHGLTSMLQGTELAVQPFGFGITLTPGQLLAPVSDLLSQVADLMLLAAVAFGVQKMLLAVGGHWLVSTVLALVAGAWIAWQRFGVAPPWLSRLVAVVLFVRLVMPVVTVGSEWVFEHFARSTYDASQAAMDSAALELGRTSTVLPALESVPVEIKESSEQVPSTAADSDDQAFAHAAPAEGGVWSRFRGVLRGAGQGLASAGNKVQQLVERPQQLARKKFEELQARMDGLVRHVIMLIVVFVFQTLVIPLALAWILLSLNKGFIGSIGTRHATS